MQSIYQATCPKCYQIVKANDEASFNCLCGEIKRRRVSRLPQYAIRRLYYRGRNQLRQWLIMHGVIRQSQW